MLVQCPSKVPSEALSKKNEVPCSRAQRGSRAQADLGDFNPRSYDSQSSALTTAYFGIYSMIFHNLEHPECQNWQYKWQNEWIMFNLIVIRP